MNKYANTVSYRLFPLVILIALAPFFTAQADVGVVAKASNSSSKGAICSALLLSEGRSFKDLSKLKVMTFNLENFETPRASSQSSDPHVIEVQKQQASKAKKIASIIREENPDLMIVEEIEGEGALHDLAANYLEQGYTSFSVESNDSKAIGFLVKSDLHLNVAIESHRDRTWIDPVTNTKKILFSRDVPALVIRDEKGSKPLFVVLGTHAKAQRDRTGDPGSAIIRKAEFVETVKIAQEYKRFYGDDLPILLAGDFNTNLEESQDVKVLKPFFQNSFDLSPKRVELSDRATHSFIPRNGEPEYHEMDGIWIDRAMGNAVLDIHVYRYKDSNGKVKALPRSMDERMQNPSDHFPLIVELSTAPMARAQ